jgi:hypothetical protein
MAVALGGEIGTTLKLFLASAKHCNRYIKKP